MSGSSFSRPGAVDLSALAAPPASAGGSFTVAVDSQQALATEVVNRSMSVLVLLSVWSPDVPESVQINDTLGALATEQGGRFVVATLDAKTNADLVDAIGIPAVPFVAAAVGGRLLPLFEEALTEAEMRSVVQQVIQAAATSGVTGTAQPFAVADTATDDGGEEPPSKYPAADDALVRGDYAGAIAAYTAALKESPADREASEGLARAQLLQRTSGVDLAAARTAAAAAPDDVDAQILVADLDLLGGHVDDAFDRMIDLVRRTSDEARDAARSHLLELFAVVGDADPRVGKARRALTAALF